MSNRLESSRSYITAEAWAEIDRLCAAARERAAYPVNMTGIRRAPMGATVQEDCVAILPAQPTHALLDMLHCFKCGAEHDGPCEEWRLGPM